MTKTNIIKIKNWGFESVEKSSITTETPKLKYGVSGYYITVKNGTVTLNEVNGISHSSISNQYKVGYCKYKTFLVAKWSKHTVFFDKNMVQVPDPRKPVNKEWSNWVKLDGEVACVDEYGEVFTTYSKEYCRLRGLDYQSYLDKVGENVVKKQK